MKVVSIIVLLAVTLVCGCSKPDPRLALLEGEDLGLGVTLRTPFSQVPDLIAQSLGRKIAHNNLSKDDRFWKYEDTYGDYRFIIGDINQDGGVDFISILVAENKGDRTMLANNFAKEFPQVKTRFGITVGSGVEDMTTAYMQGTGVRAEVLRIDAPDWHLLFRTRGNTIIGLRLMDDFVSTLPLANLEK
jgi:hypothetical protein